MNEQLLGLNPRIFSHHTVHVNGIDLHYVQGGTGPVMLLWHGFLETWYCWRKIMPGLAENYTVIAPDMRGYGDSGKPQSSYDVLTLAEDFRALIGTIDVAGKITLVAHDMGAPPALIYAATYPDEVKALVYFENPVLTTENMHMIHSFTPEGTKKGGLWWWNFAFATDMPERLVVGKEREFLTWFYKGATHDKGASIEEAAIAEYLRSFNGVDGIRGAFGIYRDVFTSIEQTEKLNGMFSKISTPVLALGGELALGKIVGPMLKGVARHVTADIVPNCGHFIQDEQPAYLLAKINEFLNDLTDKKL